jgi:hypothetical protein
MEMDGVEVSASTSLASSRETMEAAGGADPSKGRQLAIGMISVVLWVSPGVGSAQAPTRRMATVGVVGWRFIVDDLFVA